MHNFSELLKLSDVASIFNVAPCTVRRWTQSGRLPCVRTPGGQRRFRPEDVQRLIDGGSNEQPKLDQ